MLPIVTRNVPYVAGPLIQYRPVFASVAYSRYFISLQHETGGSLFSQGI